MVGNREERRDHDRGVSWNVFHFFHFSNGRMVTVIEWNDVATIRLFTSWAIIIGARRTASRVPRMHGVGR